MDLTEKIRLLEAAQGHPALLALASIDIACHTLAPARRERIKEALLAAAIPHWCDPDFLAGLLDISPTDSASLLAALGPLAFVELFPARGKDAINVHEATRLALREHLRTTDLPRWQMFSTRARARVVQGAGAYARIESLYHFFAVDQAAAAAECRSLEQEFSENRLPDVRHALAVALQELTTAGWLAGAAQVEALLVVLEIRHSYGQEPLLEADVRRVLDLSREASYASGRERALYLLGDVLVKKGSLDDALAEFQEGLAIFQRLTSSESRPHVLATAHSHSGRIYGARSRPKVAAKSLRESPATAEQETGRPARRSGKGGGEHTLPEGEFVLKIDGKENRWTPNGPRGGKKFRVRDKSFFLEVPVSSPASMMSALSSFSLIVPGQPKRRGGQDIALKYTKQGEATDESQPRIVDREPSRAPTREAGRYGTLKTVARGGMGLIVGAVDLVLQREIAMKFMLDGSKPGSVARFYQEAQVTAQLEHPNIVPVHELDLNEGGQPFYTMKLVRGISLKRVLEFLALGDSETVRQWPLSALLTVFQKICDAIAFAHSKGVIHRDLKPANIMLGDYGEVQVMDWGLAKVLGKGDLSAPEYSRVSLDRKPIAEEGRASRDLEDTTIGPTLYGTVMGTPQYMPPEQANGEVEMMDERTDIYSLGAILYYILTLRAPFHGRTSSEVVQNVRTGQIVPFAEACAKKRLPHWPGGRLPESLAAVTLKSMSFARADRYPTVKALQIEIQAYQNGFATTAENAGAWKILELFLRRHRTLSMAVALLLLSGVIFSIYLFQARNWAERASLQAKIAKDVADKQRDAAETQVYLSDMLQAGQQFADGRPETARQLLQRHRGEPSGRDLRGWEWFYLAGQASQDRLRVDAHAGGVLALGASADGARLVTGGVDGEIALWQTRGLVPLWRAQAHPSGVLSVAWHESSKYLASGGVDGFVRVWSVEAHQLVAELRLEANSPVRCIAWRPHDAGQPTLAVGSLGKGILIWQPFGTGEAGRTRSFSKNSRGVSSVQWSDDGSKLAVGQTDADKTLEVFDYVTQQPLLSTQAGDGNDVFAVAIDPTGQYVAAGSKYLTVTVFALQDRRRRFSAPLHHGSISALAWHPGNQQLASASDDGTIRICSPITDPNSSQVLSGHSGEVNTLAWIRLPSAAGGPGPTALFSGGSDGTLRAWLPASSDDTAIAFRPENWLAAAKWSPDGTRIAAVNFRDRVFLVDSGTGLSIPVITAHGSLYDVAWSPDAARFATASHAGGVVEVFDSATGRPLGCYNLSNVQRVAWSPSGRYLAAGGLDATRIWDTRTGSLVTTIRRPTKSLVWFADERRIALGGIDGAIQIWDAFAGGILATWKGAPPAAVGSVVSEYQPPHAVFDLAWSPDHHDLAYGTQDGLAGILEGETGRMVHKLSGHSSGVWRVAWDRNGARLATAGQDGIVRLFATENGVQVAQLTHGLGTSEVDAIDWSPDGRQMLSAGFDSYLRIRDAQRGIRLDAIDALRKKHPQDVKTMRELAQAYIQLGWVSDARLTFGQLPNLEPDEKVSRTAATEAGAVFDRALDTPSADWMLPPTLLSERRRGLELLNLVQDSWEENKPEAALNAYRELMRLPGGAALRPFALNWLSRARWSVSWFTSRVDPLHDLNAWGALAHESEAVQATVHALAFPYQNGGPRALLLTPELTERGPGADHFGMIAEATIALPAGKWRLHASGGGGVRILADGQALLENWTADAPTEKFADFETKTPRDVKLTVEHFVTTPTPDFEFFLEPVE